MPTAALDFDETGHAETLESLAIQSLANGDLARAFRFADRRCRILPKAKSEHFSLRAEISHRMGYATAALSDIAHALELAPDDLIANRRMLTWGSDPARIKAAQRLRNIENDLSQLGPAITLLRGTGERSLVSVRWTDRSVTGWAIWDRKNRARVELQSETTKTSHWLTADPRHPLAARDWNAASFEFERPSSDSAQHVALYVEKRLIYRTRLPSRPRPYSQPLHRSRDGQRHVVTDANAVSIIVPVYNDYKATKSCFASLLPELKHFSGAKLIIVDDASPDIKIKHLLSDLSKRRGAKLITNAENLGFAESVNRGLQETGRDDVLLLNADTVVPHGFIARLKSAASHSRDIGTLCPLSNNGEFTSFPSPFRPNPLPSNQTLSKIDEAAQRLNAGHFIDMPNGIGFCLYITRACLDTVGSFSASFKRGYFEDVEFCLRAREHGYRNVCVPSIYIGHAGSRSFGAEKQSLVVQNLATIEQEYPRYRAECAAFIEADPLRPYRAAIERSCAALAANSTLLVTGSGLCRSVADERARILCANGENALIAEVQAALPSGFILKLSSSAQGVPQSLSFRLFDAIEKKIAHNYLSDLAPARIEIIDVAMTPSLMLEDFISSDCPVDLFVADGGLICPRGNMTRSDGTMCDALQKKSPCDECQQKSTVVAPGTEGLEQFLQKRKRLIQQARHIIAPDVRAKSFASRAVPGRKIVTLRETKAKIKSKSKSKSKRLAPEHPSVGFIATGASLREYQLIKDLAKAINQRLPEWSAIVVGQTADDFGLLKLDNVYVTGLIEPNEYPFTLPQYGINAVVVPIRQPLFGHPRTGASYQWPTAFFDWSLGAVKPRPIDLALSPYASSGDLGASIASWLQSLTD